MWLPVKGIWASVRRRGRRVERIRVVTAVKVVKVAMNAG